MKKVSFVEWKPTEKAQKIFRGMLVLYSPDTIKSEIVKITARFAGEEKTDRGWAQQVRNWFKNKPRFDEMYRKPVLTKEQEDAIYKGHRRDGSDGKMTKIGECLDDA